MELDYFIGGTDIDITQSKLQATVQYGVNIIVQFIVQFIYSFIIYLVDRTQPKREGERAFIIRL